MNRLQLEHFQKLVTDAATKYNLNQINFDISTGKNLNIIIKASFKNTEPTEVEKIMNKQ